MMKLISISVFAVIFSHLGSVAPIASAFADSLVSRKTFVQFSNIHLSGSYENSKGEMVAVKVIKLVNGKISILLDDEVEITKYAKLVSDKRPSGGDLTLQIGASLLTEAYTSKSEKPSFYQLNILDQQIRLQPSFSFELSN